MKLIEGEMDRSMKLFKAFRGHVLAILVLLVVEFVLGMVTALFVQFPDLLTNGNAWAWSMSLKPGRAGAHHCRHAAVPGGLGGAGVGLPAAQPGGRPNRCAGVCGHPGGVLQRRHVPVGRLAGRLFIHHGAGIYWGGRGVWGGVSPAASID